MKNHILIVSAALALLVSCNSADIAREEAYEFKMQMDSWLGAHISELLMSDQWGAPYAFYEAGKGSGIYHWRKYVSDIRFYQRWSGDIRYENNSYLQYWNFFVDTNGIIVKYKYGINDGK